MQTFSVGDLVTIGTAPTVYEVANITGPERHVWLKGPDGYLANYLHESQLQRAEVEATDDNKWERGPGAR